MNTNPAIKRKKKWKSIKKIHLCIRLNLFFSEYYFDCEDLEN